MLIRGVILFVVAALVVAMGVPARTVQKPKYNVIIIASDDLRPSLGCYGDKLVKTPNIDNLAARGVRFDRAYTQFPVCNPSRSSLLTGRYPTQTGVMDNELYFRALHPEFVSLPQHFKSNGYVTLRAGKIFHGGIDDTDAWTEGGEERRFTGAQRPPSNADSAERIAHSGADSRIRETIFRKPDLPAHMRLPDSRAGALSCLTGIAARRSVELKRPVQISELVKVPPRV